MQRLKESTQTEVTSKSDECVCESEATTESELALTVCVDPSWNN